MLTKARPVTDKSPSEIETPAPNARTEPEIEIDERHDDDEDEPRSRRPSSRQLAVLALLALAGGGLVWQYVLKPNGQTQYVYDTQAVGTGPVRKIVSTSGPVRALVTVSVGSQLSGQVSELKVDFNSEVKDGDILATIDDKTFKARVAQATADLAMAKAGLATQTASLEKAQAQLQQAGRATARQQTLASKGVAAPAALDTAIRDMDVAKAEIAVSKAAIENAKANIEQRKAALDQAQIDLDRTQIRSPINGTVISRTIDIGQTVAASLQAPELFKIAQDLRRIRIEAQVNEADVGQVAEGNTVSFTVDSYPERRFQGRVTQVRLAATELQNVVTYTVIIEADNDDRRLFPGMTANVQIATASRDNVLRIPNDALRFKPRGLAAPAAPATSGPPTAEQRAERMRELAEQLKSQVGFSDAQVAQLQEELRRSFSGGRSGGQGAGGAQAPGGESQQDSAQIRQRYLARIDQAIGAILTEEQKPAYAKWKTQREQVRNGSIWVLGPGDQPISRRVRLGIADEQSTEIVGGDIKAGERVIVRAREAGRK
jgi:HlyD family secretion protein